MIVYALKCSVGISSGYNKIVGIYSTREKAEEAKAKDMRKTVFSEWHYKIIPIEIDKTINETYVEW